MKINLSTKEKFDWNSFLRELCIIAIPVALQNLLTTTGSMVDTIMLASLGEETVGAVGLCAQYSELLFSSYWGFVGGGMLFLAQYWGAKDHDGIVRAFGLTLSIIMLVAFAFSGFALYAPELCLSLYTDKEALRDIGVSYISICAYAYPLQALSVGISTLLRSIERVRLPMFAGFAAVIVNCVCNYILIYGKLGFPALGAPGAAIGTVISAVVNVLVLIIVSYLNHTPYLFKLRGYFRWTRAFIREFIWKSLPILANELAIGISNLLIATLFGHQVESVIAAMAVLRTLESLIVGFFSGFSNAATVLVGKKVGEGEPIIAYRRAIRIVYFCAGMTAVICCILLLVHDPLLHAMGLSGDSYHYGFAFLATFSVVALIRMQNWVQNDIFRSAGNPAFGSTLEITFMYLLVLPTIYFLAYKGVSPIIIFMCCYIDEPIRYIMMQYHMYSGKWIRPVTEEGKRAMETLNSDN